MDTMITKTRFLGKCGVCEGDFKLNDGKLVHHGYQRPGDGSIHGDCFAVGREPHETSPTASQAYKALLEEMLKIAEESLANLQNGKVTKLLKQVQKGYGKNAQVEAVLIKKDENPREFEALLKSEIWCKEANIRQVKSDISRMDALLTDWTAKPVRTIEEEAAKQDADRQARKDAKEAARQEKIAKKVSFYQKRIDSAFAKKNASGVRDAFEAVLSASSGLKLSYQEMLDLVDRKHVWDFFGLVCPTSWRDDVNFEAMKKMWQEGYWPEG